MNRLLREEASVVLVVAGAGYGKTTLLAQWAAAETRPVAWLSLDPRHNEPLVLLKHLVAAVDRMQRLDHRMLTSLSAARSATPSWIVDRAVRALAACRRPFLFVLDDAHVLEASAARRLLAVVIAEAPAGSTVALAGRAAPSLAAAAQRDMARLDVDDLAFGKHEAQLLCAAMGADERDAEAVIELCQGWPAALRLAVLSLRDRGQRDQPVADVPAIDRYLAEYVRKESLCRLDPRDLGFLRRTAILDELTGPVCDAVLHEHGSAATLTRLARAEADVVTVDELGRHRCRRVIRDVLLRELQEDDPELVRLLHRRAAAWNERTGDARAALVHARVAHDTASVERTVSVVALRGASRTQMAELEPALVEVEADGNLGRYPLLALHGGWLHAFDGRAAAAERWIDLAQRCARRPEHPPGLRERLAVLRAAMCRAGARRMLADASTAIASLEGSDPWYAAALHMRGTAAVLLDAGDEADDLLTAAVRAADEHGCHETQMIAVAQLSVLSRGRGDHARAKTLTDEALRLGVDAELEGRPSYALALAAAARCALRQGRWADARELVDRAAQLRSSLTVALPWLASATRLEIARCYATLRDDAGARRLVAELDGILALRPRLGTLALEAAELRRELEGLAPATPQLANLTPAELRLLPLLGTYLSFREIAERLGVSRNTVKTQAISIYRKLGVSGRSQAMAAAADLQPSLAA